MFTLQQIDWSWTLFLDRDGVINEERPEDYVKSPDEFIFYPDSVAAISLLSTLFSRICVVTNQKGIGKGLMGVEDLEAIHQKMRSEISGGGGRIDAVYFCSDLSNDSFYRKPNPGMAYLAKEEFPDLDFDKTLMVGNKLSDMEFGRNAGIHTVFIASTNPDVPFPHPLVDCRFESLYSLAMALKNR